MNFRPPGWKYSMTRGMLYDSSGRFRVFRSPREETRLYMLEDRKNNSMLLFETQELAMAHAEMVKDDEKGFRIREEKKQQIKKEVEFVHVSSSGGYYYWKKDAAKKWREQRCKD